MFLIKLKLESNHFSHKHKIIVYFEYKKSQRNKKLFRINSQILTSFYTPIQNKYNMEL